MNTVIQRRWELDALRGLMLVMMFSTHLPTRFSIGFGQTLGYVSAAEGFVMLSAFMAGMIYTSKAMRDGVDAMRRAFFKRTLTVYACHVACLLLLFTLIAALGLKFDQSGLKNLIGYYLENPVSGLLGGIMLIYNPPLLDILPLYVMLLLISPWILAHGMRHGWRGIFIVSITLWLAAQFGLSSFLYSMLVAVTGLPVPFRETGSFETFAWQLLWVFGLWLGSLDANGVLQGRNAFMPRLVWTAVALALMFFIWRHTVGQIPFPGNETLNLWLDKWHLGPLRLLNFMALLVIVMHIGSAKRVELPRFKFLETMGAASLPVFCAHLILVLLTLAIIGDAFDERFDWMDEILLSGGLVLLYLSAMLALRFRSRQPVSKRF
ncbi:acyltransferase [Herminiimonas sp. KBW02]|uniref:OpgC domain-containing protein n=1 Tax=Herminiimonas sp. KBW02 TaxID=2153363 RepID=UPI000F5AD878|nr:OpgC domain-containing protein [Herminiimonas sp. KBW02]RQO37394.1 acyltransferase [Herminiimonas sp. KBW02]